MSVNGSRLDIEPGSASHGGSDLLSQKSVFVTYPASLWTLNYVLNLRGKVIVQILEHD